MTRRRKNSRIGKTECRRLLVRRLPNCRCLPVATARR
jgi:hypothetical protein